MIPVLTVTFELDGEPLQVVTLTPKTFKTGSRGFHGFGKMAYGKKHYQVNVLAIEIGSKPK